jgi:sugar phosphate isomerase/epimerase
MRLVATTSSFWFRGFAETLEIIAAAGGEDIEVALHWARNGKERAQHLKGVSTKDARMLVEQHGLRATNIHNVGGVAFVQSEPAAGVFDDDIFEWIDDRVEQCLVFHLPCILDPAAGQAWWQSFEQPWADAISAYKGPGRIVTAENLKDSADRFTPVYTLDQIRSFLQRHELLLTFDTTQCLQAGFDLLEAADALAPWIANVHLGEVQDGRPHAFVGESGIDWPAFFRCLDPERVRSVTLEFTMTTAERRDVDMSNVELADRLRLGFDRVASYLQ